MEVAPAVSKDANYRRSYFGTVIAMDQ